MTEPVDAIDPLDAATLTLLAAIAEAGSLTAAARAVGSTQPALSKRLKRLEEALGVTLFERGVHGVQPTDYGAALLPRARAIREQARAALEEVAQLRGSREGRLCVALSHFATLALLPCVLPAFRERWPGVSLRIKPPPFQLGGLREGDPDFAVMSLPAARPPAEYVVRPLYTTTIAVVVRNGHRLAHARGLGALADADWVMPSLDSSIAHGMARAFTRARLGRLRCPVTCETLTGLETIVSTTDLVGAVPLEVFAHRAAASGLVRVPLEPTIEAPQVVIVRWAHGRPTPASATLEQAFIDAAHALAKARRR